jgi:anthranilate synthase component 2
MILVIDNYDSFTWNLVQLLGKLHREVRVVRNDDIDLEGIRRLAPERILVSPGPGRPEDAGVSMAAIREFAESVPLLGVCLGHQAIGAVFGGRVVHAPELMHGRTSEVQHDGSPLYRGVSNPFIATRYHSLVLDQDSFPSVLHVTARTAGGVIMGVRHRTLPVEGVQFHPESILTVEGERMLANWLEEPPRV